MSIVAILFLSDLINVFYHIAETKTFMFINEIYTYLCERKHTIA